MAQTLTYTYLKPSLLHEQDGSLGLALATSGGSTPERARAGTPLTSSQDSWTRPDVIAASLLVVARVARTRYYTPPGMVAAILRGCRPGSDQHPRGTPV